MENITIHNESGEEISFDGELVAETEEEHVVERNHPTNTETVQLYKKMDGKFLLAITFQFDDMDPHHHESHEGDSPQAILKSLVYASQATQQLIESL